MSRTLWYKDISRDFPSDAVVNGFVFLVSWEKELHFMTSHGLGKQTGCTRQCSVCCQVTHGKILGRQHQQAISYQGPWGQEHNSNSVGPVPWNFFAFSPVFPQDSYVSLPSQDWPVLSIESLPASSDLWTFRQLHFSLSIHRLLSTRTSSNVLVSSLLQSSLSVRTFLLHFGIFHFPFFH